MPKESQTVTPTLATRGSREFNEAREDMLYKFDLARIHSESRLVKAYHGKVAEGILREWLSSFLPKRFGVTSGYLTSQELMDDNSLLSHFDVIIYDQLNSPVLWTSRNPDESEHGRSRLIPVEHVHAVIEVKSRLTNKTAKDSVKKLMELIPFLQGIDSDGERYPQYLPRHLYLGCLFFEMAQSQRCDTRLLNCFIPAFELRGFHGVTVLRTHNISPKDTRITYIVDATSWSEHDQQERGNRCPWSGEFQGYNGQRLRYTLGGSPTGFQMFAFDLLARNERLIQAKLDIELAWNVNP